MTSGVRPLVVVVAALVLAVPAAGAAAPTVKVKFASARPKAGERWEYAVFVTDARGRAAPATVVPQVFVGGRLYDTLGAHYTLLGIVAEPYTWSRRLRGRDVVFKVTVTAIGKNIVRRYPFHVY